MAEQPLLKDSVITPLWVLYPQADPLTILVARQGVEEAIQTTWWAEYLSLPQEARTAYLDHHQAPAAWREAIDSIISLNGWQQPLDPRIEQKRQRAWLEQEIARFEAHAARPYRWWQWGIKRSVREAQAILSHYRAQLMRVETGLPPE